jgi:hypothetical protein
VPAKSRKSAISEQTFTGGEEAWWGSAAHHRVAGPCDGERDRDDHLCKVGVRGAELLTIPPMRIAMGATVFLIGVLTGAGIAAWMMPPV